MHGMRPPPHPTSANFISSSSPNRAAGWGGTSWLANPHSVASSQSRGHESWSCHPRRDKACEIRTTSNHIHTSARFCQQARDLALLLCAVPVAWDELDHPGSLLGLAWPWPWPLDEPLLPSFQDCRGTPATKALATLTKAEDCCTSKNPGPVVSNAFTMCFLFARKYLQFVEALDSGPTDS